MSHSENTPPADFLLCIVHCTPGKGQSKGAVSALVLSHSSVCCERTAGPGSAVQCKPVKCTLQMTKLAVQTLRIRYIAEHPCVVCKWLGFSNGPPSPIRGNSKQSATRTLDSKLLGTILKWENWCRSRKENFPSNSVLIKYFKYLKEKVNMATIALVV